MNFVCVYCKKATNEITVMVDKKHFLHRGCEEAFKKDKLIDKWKPAFEKGGFLYGLKGPVNENIAKGYECCKSILINQ
jgi:hypothetical protein